MRISALRKVLIALLLSASAWSEASYMFETEIRTDNGKEYKPRVACLANHQAEIKIGPPDHPDVRMVMTPRPASSNTVTIECTVEMRNRLGGRDLVTLKAETELGQAVRWECGDRSFELRVQETR